MGTSVVSYYRTKSDTGEATQKKVCKYHDVIEYLNISDNRELFLYTIPKKNWEEHLVVGLDFTLASILSVVWTNEFVSWNPMDFCNISKLTVPMNLFWSPEIYIDERADDDKFTPSPFVLLSSSGSIFMFQAYRLTSSCSLDIQAFPFDNQKCNLTLMSSIHSDKEIIMKSIKTSKKANQDTLTFYLTYGEWKFEEVRIIEHMIYYEGVNFSAVTYEIAMKRRSVLYVIVLILPTAILFLLDMAISYAFAAPGEKIAFKITLILQVSFLSMILVDKLPSTSDDPPVIAIFFTGMFMFLVLGILENAFVLYLKETKPKFLSFKGKKFMSRFLRKKKEKDGSEDPVTDLATEMAKDNKLPSPEKDSADNLVFLQHLNVELQQIKKHLALEDCQDAPSSVKKDKTFLWVEKWLYFTRLLLSLAFLAYVIIQWAR
ncbi:5-hydroxytryptamine receptor 3A-like [Elgaria multicarinata webbii]|uniref:5-hydroxytryptamine receptor 3A-like n=1 Tax=Elgaria multicarinata webbii TaxID=159646 RepID=UPI002FCD68C2